MVVCLEVTTLPGVTSILSIKATSRLSGLTVFCFCVLEEVSFDERDFNDLQLVIHTSAAIAVVKMFIFMCGRCKLNLRYPRSKQSVQLFNIPFSLHVTVENCNFTQHQSIAIFEPASSLDAASTT
jgi:hypothetical protein